MKKRRKSKWVVCIIAVTILVVAISAGDLINRSAHTFTVVKWQRVEDRLQIVNSLQNKHDLTGMTHSEIEGLLGRPSKELNGNTWMYELAVQPEMESLVVIPVLRIEFTDGLVIGYEVDGNA